MLNIKIENGTKREKKLEENPKKVYVIIFKEFCRSHMQNIIKKNLK